MPPVSMAAIMGVSSALAAYARELLPAVLLGEWMALKKNGCGGLLRPGEFVRHLTSFRRRGGAWGA